MPKKENIPSKPDSNPLTYEILIERIKSWASDNSDVSSALILGSRARSDHPADAWSDLDLLIFADQHENYIHTEGWVGSIAPYWLSFIEQAGNGQGWERRTLFHNGLDVDMVFYPADAVDELINNMPADVGDIIRRGVKILVDKKGKLAKLMQRPLPDATLFRKPSQGEFVNSTGNFWYHTLWSVKHLRRGELWWAKFCVDGYLKSLLQEMLEWHARATRGEKYDTWLRGRFLEEWADPRAVSQLGDIFAHYDPKDIAEALCRTMDLYRMLEDETANRWGFEVPKTGEQEAAKLAIKLIEEMS